MIEVQTVVIASLIVTEALLTWRIYSLERRMMSVMKHFVSAKDFLGQIKDGVAKYHDIVDHIAKNGLDVKVKHETLGNFELSINKKEAT